jgi:hypothetical protein
LLPCDLNIILLLDRYSDMVGGGGGTVNSKKMMGGVFKKITAKSAAGNNNGFEFTVRDTAVRIHFTSKSEDRSQRRNSWTYLGQKVLRVFLLVHLH